VSYHARVRRSGIAIAVMLASSQARAEPFAGWRATGDLALDLRAIAGAAGDVEVGPGLRATAGKRWLAYAIGLDVRAGGGVHGGFAFDTTLYPIGVSILHGAPVSLRVVGGVGAGGVTGRLPIAARFPVEAELEVHPAKQLELSAWAEVAYALRTARAGGAPDAPWGDELTLGATIRVGRGAHESEFAWSNGWRLGGTFTERVGEKVYGLVIGWGIDISGGPMSDYD
jgi:hypothetical protein